MARENWQVDGTHSNIRFTVKHMVISKVHGRFARWSASLEMDEKKPADSSLDVTIEAASIDTSVADRDTHLRSPDFFDVQKFPTMTYKSRRIDGVSSDAYRVVGDLTMHGVTREIVLETEFGGRTKDPWGNERAGFSAKTSLNRKDFGLTWSQVLETGGLVVGDRVDVEIEVEFVKQAAVAKVA
jgi:polyisoprenoid-binding protein YceI